MFVTSIPRNIPVHWGRKLILTIKPSCPKSVRVDRLLLFLVCLFCSLLFSFVLFCSLLFFLFSFVLFLDRSDTLLKRAKS